MPFGLDQNAVTGVDENDGQIGGGRAGGHVAGVLLVSGRVGDDEFALVGRKIAVSDIDRDALLPLVFQAVGEESQVDFFARCAEFCGVFLDGRQLIFVDHLGFVKETADESALAIIDRAAGDKAQEFFALVLREILVNVGRDQGRLVRHACPCVRGSIEDCLKSSLARFLQPGKSGIS